MSWPTSWGPAPRFATARTPERETFGPQVGRIARLLGYEPLPWQQYVWDVALEVQSEAAGDPSPGEWAYDTVTFTAPRRSGKTTTLQPVVMHRAELIRRATLFLTAQSGKAAARRWQDLAAVIEDSYMGDRVRKRDSPGSWRLTWLKSKSVLEPFAPKDDSAHGDEPDLVLATEIWKYDAAQGAALDQAIRPTFLTNNAQFWRESTAGTSASAYYNGVRRVGRKATEEDRRLGTFYLEFSIPDEWDGTPVEQLPDAVLVDLVIAHHPRTDIDMRRFLVEELEQAQQPEGEGRAGFLRAYGNHSADRVERPAIVPAEVMASGLTTDQIPQGVRVGLAFDLDPEGREGSIAAAWRGPDGRAIGTVIRCQPGTRWVAPDLVGITERGLNEFPLVGVNDTSVTRDTTDLLELAGIPMLKLNLKDYAACCTRWLNETTAVTDDPETGSKRPTPTLLHQGNAAYLDAVEDVALVDAAGGGRKFAVRERPITALTAVAKALWTYDHLPEPETEPAPFRIR